MHSRILVTHMTLHIRESSSELSSSSGKRALAQAQADLYKYLGIDDRDDPESMPRPARRSFIMASPSTTISPVARDDKAKALRRMSDITDHRMTRGSGLCDRFQAFMKENEVRRISYLRGSPDHVTDDSSLYSPMPVISAVKRQTLGHLMNYLTYNTALSYAEHCLFIINCISYMPLHGPGRDPPTIHIFMIVRIIDHHSFPEKQHHNS